MHDCKINHFVWPLDPTIHVGLESNRDGVPQWIAIYVDGHGHPDDPAPTYGAKIDVTLHLMGGDRTDDAELIQARALLEQLRDSASHALTQLGQSKLDV